MTNATPSIAQLQRALTIHEQIATLQAEMRSILGGNAAPASTTPSKRGGKRTMSPATIAKMRASQQARWATKRGESSSTPAKPLSGTKKGKRTMSAEGRAKISAAAKKRWATIRAKS